MADNKVEVFICYAHQDESLMRELERQLSTLEPQELITIWHDRMIAGGADWKKEIDTHLNSANIILLLVSSNFTASKYSQVEVKRAMERYTSGEAQVIPVILKPVMWKNSVFGKLSPLPTDGKAITSRAWHNQDEAWIDVAEGVQKAVDELRKPVVPIATQSSSTKEQQPMTQNTKDEKFDVFLCHNSQDKPQVKEIARQLQAQGLKPWLDEWELRPGLPWQRVLEEQIEQIRSAAIFVGKNGRGPWQDMELEAFIREFVSRKCPVIPVVLADAPDKPVLPVFLRGMTWVDFRKQEPDPMGQLIWGVKGENPNVIPGAPSPSVLDIRADAIEWEKQFQENDYTGSLREPSLRIIEGSIPVVLSCPHAVKHYRGGRSVPEEAEIYTGALTIQLASLTNAHALIFARTSKEDPNYDAGGEYKSQLKDLVIKSQARFVLDIHGLAQSRSTQIGVGTGDGYNLLEQKNLLDVLRNTLEKAGFKVDVDKPEFAASGPNTIGSFTSRKLGIPALQIEVHSEYRDPKHKAEEYARLLHALNEAIRGIVELLFAPKPPTNLAPFRRHVLEEKLKELQGIWKRRNARKQRIQQELDIENDPTRIFRYEEQIKQENNELAQLESEIEQIEQQLQ